MRGMVFLWVLGACGGGTPAGQEGGACYPNGTCNEGLVCLSNLCVRLPDSGVDASSADAGGTPDALAGDGGNDSSVGDAGGTVDASTGDGSNGSDASTDDAGAGPVTARALDVDGSPLAGVNVAFSMPDGTLISTATTSASGQLTETVPAGAIIAFGYSTGQSSVAGSFLVQVMFGVQPGDVIEANMFDAFVPVSSDFLGTSTLMFVTLHAGASSYTVGHKCASSWPGVTVQTANVDFYSNPCSGRATVLDLLGIAWNASNAPSAWTMFEDVQIGAATTFSSTGWNTNFALFNAFYTNTPYDGEIELDVGLIRDGIDYGIGGFANTVGPLTAGQNAAYVVPVPASFTQTLNVGAQYRSTARDRLLIHQINLMSNTTSNSVDLSGLGYPTISSVTLDTAIPARPAYQWTLGGAVPATAQALVAFTKWSEANGQWAVAVLAPPDTAAPLRLPALPNNFLVDPATLSPRWPPTAGTTPVHNMVGLMEVGSAVDYAQLRTERGLTGLIRGNSLLSPTAPLFSRSVLSAGGVFEN